MNRIFLILLIFIPLTVIGYVIHLSPVVLFILSALSIVPLAKYIGQATEEVTIYTGPGLGGLLNATFGNATELIISIFALRAGLIEVVKASITGSIISNLLLVLGTAIIAGGWKRKKQSFNPTAAKASAATLLLAVVALVIPAIFVITSHEVNPGIVEKLSIVVSIFMIISYGGSLLFSLKTHRHLYEGQANIEAGIEEATWSKTRSIITLFICVAIVVFMSEILVGSIEPLIVRFGWTELFIGVIFIAIVGNAAEHTSAITAAMKNKMDLALNISIGSATQIAMFVAPILVMISLLYKQKMNLVFNTFELVSIIFSVFVVNSIVEDGESNWFEGMQLLLAYAIIAVAFYFHP